MNDVDLLKSLLETEQAAKALVDEAQEKADTLISQIKQQIHHENSRALEEALREHEEKMTLRLAALEQGKREELERYKAEVLASEISQDSAFNKLRELLKNL